jgi:PAS domain S-box-containing protein
LTPAPSKGLQRLASACSLVAICFSFALLTMYFFSVPELFSIHLAYERGVPVTAALLLLILGSGILMTRVHTGFMAVLVSTTTAGVAARHLLLTIFFLPLFIGFIFSWLRLSGALEPRFAYGGGTTLILTTIIAFLWRTTMRLDSAETELRGVSSYTRGLIEASLDPLVTIGPDGKITDVNEATEKATGLSRTRLIGTDFSDYFSEPARARAGYEKVFREGEVRDYSLEIRHLNGRLTPVLYNATVYRSQTGEVIGIFAVARDITERLRAEEELHRLNRELENRVRARTMQLEASNTELEAFSYSASHVLRAPLRAVDGFARILTDEYSNKLDAEGQRLLKVIRDSAIEMGRLIDDILEFSHISRLEVNETIVDIGKLAQAAFDELSLCYPERKMRLEIRDLPLCWADAKMLAQVMKNLVSNAVKFTKLRDEAIIEVGGIERPHEIEYHVKDNGMGFDMTYAHKLFRVFERIHGYKDFEGSGMGLAVVKRIITKHGGKVWADGRLDEGAVIHFTLPKKEALCKIQRA